MVALPLGEEKENYARSIFLVPQLLKTRTNFPTPPCEKRGRVGVARPSNEISSREELITPTGIRLSGLRMSSRTIRRQVGGGNPFFVVTASTKRSSWPIYKRRIVDDRSSPRPWNSQSLPGFCPRGQETTTPRYRSVLESWKLNAWP